MSNINILSMLFLAGSLFTACSSEDQLTPSNLDTNAFAANEQDSVLQHGFYERVGSYLLFKDTLSREAIGVDKDGNTLYHYETVDIGYSLTGLSNNRYSYKYLRTAEDKKAAAVFLENRIMSAMRENIRPYSVLAVEQTEESVLKGGGWNKSNIDFFVGYRCVAISLKGIAQMNETQLAQLAERLLAGMVTQKITSLGIRDLGAFYAHGDKYYFELRKEHPEVKDEKEVGFLSSGSYTFPKREEDLKAYLNAYFSLTEEEFLQKYEAYPVIGIKYNLLKDLIKQVGFILSR